MTTILSKPTDTTPIEDWREGLVWGIDRNDLPLAAPRPDHVYGKTELTKQERRQLGHRLDDEGFRFVVVYTSLARGTRTPSHELKHGEALRFFADGAKVVGLLAAMSGAASTVGAVTVHRVDEWRKNDRSKRS